MLMIMYMKWNSSRVKNTYVLRLTLRTEGVAFIPIISRDWVGVVQIVLTVGNSHNLIVYMSTTWSTSTSVSSTHDWLCEQRHAVTGSHPPSTPWGKQTRIWSSDNPALRNQATRAMYKTCTGKRWGKSSVAWKYKHSKEIESATTNTWLRFFPSWHIGIIVSSFWIHTWYLSGLVAASSASGIKVTCKQRRIL